MEKGQVCGKIYGFFCQWQENEWCHELFLLMQGKIQIDFDLFRIGCRTSASINSNALKGKDKKSEIVKNFITFVEDSENFQFCVRVGNVITKTFSRTENNLRIFSRKKRQVNHSKCPLKYSISITFKWLTTLFFHQRIFNFTKNISIADRSWNGSRIFRTRFYHLRFRENCFRSDTWFRRFEQSSVNKIRSGLHLVETLINNN